MISNRGDRLIQVQNGWFAHNWRKVGQGEEYPRYDKTIRSAFEAQLVRVVDYVHTKEIGKFIPKQCEVTYINHILPSDIWANHGDARRVFRPVGHSPSFPG
jgi:hypothetical protein